MSDNIKILKNYLIYFLLMILVCMVGISNVFADTFENIGYLDNDSYVSVRVGYTSQQLNLARTNQYQLSQVEEMYIEIENYNFQGGTTYSIEFYTPSTPLAYVNAFGAYGETSTGQPVSCETAGIYNDDVHYLNFKFNCSTTVNYLQLNLFNSSSNYIMDTGIFQWNYVYLRKVISSSGNEIIESQNAQIIQGQKDIIDNQTQNTQDIISNNNENTNKIIEDNKKNFQTCRDSVNIFNVNRTLGVPSDTSVSNTTKRTFNYNEYVVGLSANNYYVPDNVSSYSVENGNITITSSLNAYGLGFPVMVKPNTYYTLSYDSSDYSNSAVSIYKFDGEFLSYSFSNTFKTSSNDEFVVIVFIPTTRDTTVTFSNIQLQEGTVSTDYEPYGEEICVNKLDEQTNAINGLNDSLNDDDTDGATSEASDFFSSFTTNTFGLTSIITAPLNLIQSLTSSTCSDLHLPLPYLNNKYLDLPCMTSIYQTHFGTFFTMYQTITYGIIAYWVCVRIFNQVKDFKNPEHDEIEVVDL